MRVFGSRSSCCQRLHPARTIAWVVLLSIFAGGGAFTGIGQPMSHLKHRVSKSSLSSPGGLQLSTLNRRPTPQMTAGNSGEEEVGFVEKVTTAWGTVIEQGDPDDLPPCPSGVSDLAKPIQALIVAGVFAGLGAGTVAVLAGLQSLEAALPAGWYAIWQFTWAPLLGLTFSAAGIAHFTLLREFCNIYPGRGAWGFWYLPGTSSFHVKWTGIAELAGGVGLALGGLGVGAELGLERAAAAGLFALVLAVTPANIYMFSHGAQLPEGLEVPVFGHAVRGFFQCVLLAFFLTLATS
ncbi:unnamed protein product [Ectocarpus sp. 12 AP-2014]